jgi:ABC-type multidrug transport system fused ATPase/permease subunit
MRIAVLIITLILGIFLFLQTILVYMGGGLTSDASLSGAGAVGLLIALMWLVAAAFVIGVPLISTIIFVVAGILGLGVAGSSTFSDMAVWGIASFVLAALSFIGLLTKRRGARVKERNQRERDARLAASIRESVTTAPFQQLPSNVATCSQCGSTMSISSRFCQECGAPRVTPAGTLPASGG